MKTEDKTFENGDDGHGGSGTGLSRLSHHRNGGVPWGVGNSEFPTKDTSKVSSPSKQ